MGETIDPLRIAIQMRDPIQHTAAVGWCLERFGPERRKFYGELGRAEDGDWRWVRTCPVAFYFKHEDHALEFKLRWG